MKTKTFFWGLIIAIFLCLTNLSFAQKKIGVELPDYIAPKDRICFALYTVHENTLKLTAQFYPIKDNEPVVAILQIKEQNKWVNKDTADIIYPGYTAPFRIENWDDSKEQKYRVAHNNKAFYEGIIRKNPHDKNDFVMAVFTGNTIYPQHGGDIPRTDIVENLKKVKPDLLFFSGDQVYDHADHYLHWLKFGRDFGELIRNTPTICLPDDHDVGQYNIWGVEGIQCDERNGRMGGYFMPVEYVKEVERAQTSHLPDPYDPTPVKRGIGVYYTDLKWGGLSFAILEDRKFKSAPAEFVIIDGKPTDSVFDPAIDTRQFDHPDAKLLGDRQLKFLEDWTADWTYAEMKTVLSQTIFAQGNNYSGKHERELLGDFDTNGWPQVGRNRALSVIRKSFACRVAGDQHLATVIHHGIDEWNGAGYSFCCPSIANYWTRWWDPKKPGKNRKPGAPHYTGEFIDGFHNKITMHATANPTVEERAQGGKLSTRAAGFGLVKYEKSARTITFECWPRNVDITDPASKQYEGWPITISQTDNFSIKSGYELPKLKISKDDQVVTIRNAYTKAICSSLRINGKTYQPKVLNKGAYDILVGEGAAVQYFYEVRAKSSNKETISVKFE
ncbi:MAG: hypothetical protein DWQ10_04335 [Calditrichaeota bacterium]|nr:MAG: hypothetical protein DWQ10_04335 [Calditrichota bacterium]